MPHKTFAEITALLMGDMPRAEFAARIGVDTSSVTRMLDGKQSLTFERIMVMEDACGRPRGFILALAGYATAEGVRAAERATRPLRAVAKGGKGQLPADPDPRNRTT